MSAWYKSWFASPNYLKVYSHRNQNDAKNLINLIIKVTNLKEGEKILDAACGAGRHAFLLSKLNYQVFGFDLSKTLLSEAKKNFLNGGIKANFFLSDIRYLPLKGEIDLILNLFTSFGYFDSDEENFKFARESREILKEGKYFVLDYLNKDFIINNLVEESVRNVGTLEIKESRRIINGRIEKKIIIDSGEKKEKFVESVRLYTKEEIKYKFENIGYKLKYCFGDYFGNEFINESERLVLFFQK